ncbi:MAG: hypothetical protein LBC18_10820 [Opitutaceae bacterium]|jgi:hypothetical protein|nr:hypothetical protein [Opitutaceae bacterium]
MDIPAYPALSTAANAAVAKGIDLPAPFQSFRFAIPPGEARHFDGLGNRLYVATATGEIEISTDGTSFELWDTAMELDFGPNHFFRRVHLRNPGGDAVTGILYTGFAGIGDHRMHQVGETRLTLENQAGTAYENTAMLNDTGWKLIAPTVTGKREVWIAVERADGGDGPAPAAWWRANSSDDTRVPSHEIGLALDGITRLPFSDRIEVCTDDAGAGLARVRFWLVSFMDAGGDTAYGPPAPEETLLVPQMSAPNDYQGLAISATKSNEDDIYKLFDRDLSTEFVCGDIGQNWWGLSIGFGAQYNITRIAAKWNNVEVKNADYGPKYMRVLWSPDNVSWHYLVGEGGDGCGKAVALGQVIFAHSWESGQAPARALKFEVLRPWNRKAGASHFRLAALEIYTKDPVD